VSQTSNEIPRREEVHVADHAASHPGSYFLMLFYRRRNRFYLSLSLFVLGAGLPQILVPSLRQRLFERAGVIRENLSGNSVQPKALTAQVGENQAPFPQEYERVVPPVPQIAPPVFVQNQVYRPMPPSQSAGRKSQRREGRDESPEASAAAQPPDADNSAPTEPEFLKGKMEQEAYDLLIQNNPVAAGLTRSGMGSAKFSGWSAAKLDEDTYLVRITLVRDGAEVPYIWQVRIGTKQNSPLNYNARALPKP
jgi:hypothetical protein